MRAPRRRTLRRGGRRAEAPFQGASAALSMATLAGAASWSDSYTQAAARSIP